jgi:dihydrofolate reductase
MFNEIKINHIVAINNLGYIGKDNKLLCEDPADLKHFKEAERRIIRKTS